MKITKLFGFVLFLHLGVIAVLVVQPGCRTTQPPTKTYQQTRTVPGSERSAPGGLIPAVRVEGVDPAFNAGIEDRTGSYVQDAIEPLEPLPSVDVAGPSFETYTVKKGDSLWAISKRYGVSLNELYEANGLNKNSVLKIGQQIRIPTEGGTATVAVPAADAYQPSTFDSPTTEYTVRSGDTLSGIARRYDTTVSAIKAANGISSDMIRVGQKLVIPVGPSASGQGAAPAAPAAPASAPGGTRVHVVQSGEYPAAIARRYGMTTNELLALNSISDPRSLQVGQKLRVSGTGEAANVDSREETVSTPAPPPAPSPSTGPVEIRVVEADPLVEGRAAPAADPGSVDEEALFEDAVEIPVIRLDE